MSNVAKLFNEPTPMPSDEYLGPARVLEVETSALRVELPGGVIARAELALAFPYEPAPEDVVLVIGKGKSRYVIGVLRGSGRTVLSIEGDVALRAVGGALSLSGDKGVNVEGPEFAVSVGKIRMVADSIAQKFTTAYQHVRSLLGVRAGETHTVVDGAVFSRSKNSTILTEEKMAINGKEIHLG